MARRKTVSIESLTATVNGMLANSSDEMRESREALGVLLERVLMDADAYGGFSYLQVTRDARGELVSLGDESRRRYGYLS